MQKFWSNNFQKDNFCNSEKPASYTKMESKSIESTSMHCLPNPRIQGIWQTIKSLKTKITNKQFRLLYKFNCYFNEKLKTQTYYRHQTISSKTGQVSVSCRKLDFVQWLFKCSDRRFNSPKERSNSKTSKSDNLSIIQFGSKHPAS